MSPSLLLLLSAFLIRFLVRHKTMWLEDNIGRATCLIAFIHRIINILPSSEDFGEGYYLNLYPTTLLNWWFNCLDVISYIKKDDAVRETNYCYCILNVVTRIEDLERDIIWMFSPTTFSNKPFDLSLTLQYIDEVDLSHNFFSRRVSFDIRPKYRTKDESHTVTIDNL